jgi:hypothetical protein
MSTRAALIVATGVLASSISIPLGWHKQAAQAARSTATASRLPTATLPADADHPTVQPTDKAEAETWSGPEIITALEECMRLLTPTGADLEV